MKFISLLILFYSLSAFSLEGFYTRDAINSEKESLPPSVKSVWNSTFGVFPKLSGSAGSAFVVKKLENGTGKASLYFLTSAHVVRSNCGSHLGHCPGIILSSSKGFDNVTRMMITTDDRDRTFDGVKVVKLSDLYDLAVLEVIVDNIKFNDVRAVHLERDCSLLKPNTPLYIIGYPGTYLRASAPGITQNDKFLSIKRWSSGIFLNSNFMTSNQGNLASTTADSLPGNSGGPAVDSQGRVFGVLDATLESSGTSYKGNEKSSPKYPHALLETCEAISVFRDQ